MRDQDTPPLGAAAGPPSDDSEREIDVSALEFLSAEDLELMAEAEVTPPALVLPPRRRPLLHMGPREFGIL